MKQYIKDTFSDFNASVKILNFSLKVTNNQ